MSDGKNWKKTSDFENLPTIQWMEKIGQETVGILLSTKPVTSKKDGETYIVHTLQQGENKVQIFGKGLLNWILDPANGKVKFGDEIKIIYKGLEKPEEKAGKKNRHQVEVLVAEK